MMIESQDQQGSEDDFTALYRDYYEQLLRLAVLLTGDAGVAEDAVDEAFIRVHDVLGHSGPESPFAYLRRTVVCLCRSGAHHRPPRRRLAHHGLAPRHPARPRYSAAASSLADDSAFISALRSIPARQREALVLRYWADLPETEIAALMGISISAVKNCIYQAMSRLKIVLE
jgi:RNA polymerase sigma factor (sigma-70 family)